MKIFPKTTDAARFDGEGAKRLRMPRDANPYPPGVLFDAWDRGWWSIPKYRRSDFRERATSLGRSPAPSACPERPNKGGPND